MKVTIDVDSYKAGHKDGYDVGYRKGYIDGWRASLDAMRTLIKEGKSREEMLVICRGAIDRWERENKPGDKGPPSLEGVA